MCSRTTRIGDLAPEHGMLASRCQQEAIHLGILHDVWTLSELLLLIFFLPLNVQAQ